MAQLSKDEYTYLMKRVKRFLKDRGLWERFLKISMAHYKYNKEVHRDVINSRLNSVKIYDVAYKFFDWIPCISDDYPKYDSQILANTSRDWKSIVSNSKDFNEWREKKEETSY